MTPNNVQEMSMTVAIDPRFEGDRKPNRAKTTIPRLVGIKKYQRSAYTESDTDHNGHLRAISDKNAECYRPLRGTEDFTVDELPSVASC